MKKRKALLFVIVLLIVAAGFLVEHSFAASDPKVDENGDVQTLNFAGSIGDKKVFVPFSVDSGEIIIKNSAISYCSAKLFGFEQSVKINQLLKIADDISAIEISGYVGVHAENRQYFYLDDQLCPKPLAFVKNGETSYNLISDEPNFLLLDFNTDGFLDVASENRNYDLDPITDGIRDIYLFNSVAKEFKFERSENFHQAAVE
ncbi:MAG: hypothetical protein NTW79_04160 [Candidatus Berkelbacteria bacterium]|nr:hypothetical protein [Candidatus Berkelbacteria bacterium]